MRPLLVLTLLLTACHFDTSTAGIIPDGDPFAPDADPNAPDADPNAPDADPNAPDAAPCEKWARQPSLLDPCVDISVESNALVMNKGGGPYEYNTDTDILSEPAGVGGALIPHASFLIPMGTVDPQAPRALVVGSLSLGSGASLRVTGPRPLIIVSWGTIAIDGDIDVSSNAIGGPGPGANSTKCIAALIGLSGEHGAGGGGGGGFTSAGGTGGQGGVGRPEQYEGGTGGTAVAAPSFRGGCPGLDGGSGNSQATGGGAGGNGGGAVHLIARSTLTIGDLINAGGQGGGGGGGNRSAGGGAGSGGYIGLEANVLQLNPEAILAANGGGGGGGGNGAESPGNPGQGDNSVALGGAGGDNPVGTGGNGGFVDTLDGQVGLPGGRGGGGGGGGVGFICFSANTTTGTASAISPVQTTCPAVAISAP